MFLNGNFRQLFVLFLVFSNKQYNFYNKSMWKMSIQYPVLGFERTTFCTWPIDISNRPLLHRNVYNIEPRMEIFSKRVWERKERFFWQLILKTILKQRVVNRFKMLFQSKLVERWLPRPEVRGSNPVIGKNVFILNICLLSTVYWKDENKEKEAGDGPFFKKPNEESNEAKDQVQDGFWHHRGTLKLRRHRFMSQFTSLH